MSTHSILRRPTTPTLRIPGARFEEPQIIEPPKQKVPLVLRPPKSVPKPIAAPVIRTKLPSRLGTRQSAYRNWMTDLIGTSYKDAVIVIRKFHNPFRIVQVDDVMMDDLTHQPSLNEIYLVLITPEKFIPTGFTIEAKKADRFRVSNWFTRNNDKAIINNVKMSPI
jgi:hypothetical protein